MDMVELRKIRDELLEESDWIGVDVSVKLPRPYTVIGKTYIDNEIHIRDKDDAKFRDPDARYSSVHEYLNEWMEYRQELRDLPNEIYEEELATGQPTETVFWPEKPSRY